MRIIKLFSIPLLSLIIIAVILFGFSKFSVSADQENQNEARPKTIGSTRSPDVLRTIISEGFEEGLTPPTGWTIEYSNTVETWETVYNPQAAHSGNYFGEVAPDVNGDPQDEVLLTPYFNPTQGSVSFWSAGYKSGS